MATVAENAAVSLAGRLYPGGGASIQIRQGRIERVEPAATSDSHGSERWIVPGFFDLQVNGFGGRDFLKPDLSIEDVEFIARAVLATGTTRFLPTMITAALDDMCRRLAVIARAIETVPLVARMCPGIHVEGPFIHPEDGPRGAHPREHVRPPNIEDYERLRDAASGKIALLTIAPDQPGASAVIAHAAQQGVLVAIGHHRGDAAAIETAVAAGARMCTHLGNGCDAVLPRLDNPIWRQLGEDRLWASFIADGHHLPAATLKCMLRAKTPQRSILVTDAMAAAGMPAGWYPLGQQEVERTPEGKVVLRGTPYLAGSAADMPTVIATAVVDGGVSFTEAITMASSNPAQVLGLPVQAPFAEGQEANLVEVDWEPAGGLRTRKVVSGRFSMDLTGSLG